MTGLGRDVRAIWGWAAVTARFPGGLSRGRPVEGAEAAEERAGKRGVFEVKPSTSSPWAWRLRVTLPTQAVPSKDCTGSSAWVESLGLGHEVRAIHVAIIAPLLYYAVASRSTCTAALLAQTARPLPVPRRLWRYLTAPPFIGDCLVNAVALWGGERV